MPETTVVEVPTLETIVTQAVADSPEKPAVPTVEETPAGEAPEEVVEEAEVEELDDYGLTKNEQLEARQLLAALKDPTKSKKVIELLARENGYTKGETTTAKEEKKIARGMVDDLKEALGPELEYLAEKMGPVFEKHLAAKTEEGLKPIKDQIDQETISRESKKAATAVEDLGKSYFDGEIPPELVAEMSKTMDRVKPSEGQTIESYMKEILAISALNKGVELKITSKTKAEKILKNRNDAASRLASDGNRSPAVGERVVNPRQQMTLDEAVRSAASKAVTQ